MSKPSVGRIVHYHRLEVADGQPNGPFAAIITAVEPMPYLAAVRPDHTDSISATVFYPGSMPSPNPFIPFSETPKPGHWSWPPTV